MIRSTGAPPPLTSAWLQQPGVPTLCATSHTSRSVSEDLEQAGRVS